MIKLNLDNGRLAQILVLIFISILSFFIGKLLNHSIQEYKKEQKNKVFLLTEEQKALVLSYYILGYEDGRADTFLHLQSKGKDTNYHLKIKEVKQRLDTLSLNK